MLDSVLHIQLFTEKDEFVVSVALSHCIVKMRVNKLPISIASLNDFG